MSHVLSLAVLSLLWIKSSSSSSSSSSSLSCAKGVTAWCCFPIQKKRRTSPKTIATQLYFYAPLSLSSSFCYYYSKQHFCSFSSLESARSSQEQQDQQQDQEYQPATNGRNRTFETLPRLYVGPSPSSSSTSSSSFVSTLKLEKDAIVSLSIEQSFYLTKVMRFFSKHTKKKKKRRRKQQQQQQSTNQQDESNNNNNKNNDNNKGKKDSEEEIDIRQCIRIFNGQNGEWLAHVLQPSSSFFDDDDTLQAKCLFMLKPQSSSSSSSPFTKLQQQQQQQQPWLFVAPIKKEPLKFLIEKCTELNAGGFVMIETEFTDASSLLPFSTFCENDDDDDDNLERSVYGGGKSGGGKDGLVKKLQARIVEASEQCERLSIPFLFTDLKNFVKNNEDKSDGGDDGFSSSSGGSNGLWNVKMLLDYWTTSTSFIKDTEKDEKVLLICRERTQSNNNLVRPILNVFHTFTTTKEEEQQQQQQQQQQRKSVAFLVGPEGGWSPSEEILFDDYSQKFPSRVKCISLGKSILRAETAAIMAVGAWSIFCDSFSDHGDGDESFSS